MLSPYPVPSHTKPPDQSRMSAPGFVMFGPRMLRKMYPSVWFSGTRSKLKIGLEGELCRYGFRRSLA